MRKTKGLFPIWRRVSVFPECLSAVYGPAVPKWLPLHFTNHPEVSLSYANLSAGVLTVQFPPVLSLLINLRS